MPRVFANDHDVAVTANHFAFVANLFDARVYLHVFFLFAVFVPFALWAIGRYFPAVELLRVLLVAIDDSASGQVVRTQLYDHAVLREDANVVLAHLA